MARLKLTRDGNADHGDLLESRCLLCPGDTGGVSGTRRPAYTAVQTTVYRLERKKALRIVKKISKANIFEAVVSRDEAHRGLIDDLLSLFGGRARFVMAHLIGSGQLTREDVEEARRDLRKLEQKVESKMIPHIWQSTLFAGVAALR